MDLAGWNWLRHQGLTERAPRDDDCVWGIKTSAPQSDLVIDFVIHPDGTTKAHFPSNRKKYIQSALNP